MVVWPFKPREEMIESLEWLTDVIRTKNLEQRFAQRLVPRVVHNLNYFLTVEEYNAAQSLIRQDESFLYPDWTLSITIESIAAGTDVSIPYEEPYSQLQIGDHILLWESSSKYEAVEIKDTDSADTFIGDISQSYSNARMVPLRQAVAPNGLRASRQAGNIITAEMAFELTDTRDIGQDAYTTYRGHDVITDCPVVASESFAEPMEWPVETFDSEVGLPVYITNRNFYDYAKAMRWHVFTRAKLYQLRRFIYSRLGRQRAFWLPSYASDFQLVSEIDALDTEIEVYPPAGITDLGISSFDIQVNGIYLRQVTNVTTTFILGKPVLRFFLDSAIGVGLGLDTRISFLHFMRFNADRVEFRHLARIGVSVAIPTIELNEL